MHLLCFDPNYIIPCEKGSTTYVTEPYANSAALIDKGNFIVCLHLAEREKHYKHLSARPHIGYLNPVLPVKFINMEGNFSYGSGNTVQRVMGASLFSKNQEV